MKALYDLKNDKNIEIKSANKSAVVVMWVREDYLIEEPSHSKNKKTE